mmetsp:Transcript_113677/g.367310  ORF Transcript_113677/g.367310 Transcript_113677/m.367310 type:complete len:157 (-) Transcript_113677:93-563(-)
MAPLAALPRVEAAAGGAPDSPMEVIQNVFLRGKRPMSALSERSCVASPAAGRPRQAGGHAVSTASCGASTMAFSEAIEATSALGRTGEHAADAAGRVPGSPPLKRPRAAPAGPQSAAEELRQAMSEARVWRSALAGRQHLGTVGTLGDWLKEQGEL